MASGTAISSAPLPRRRAAGRCPRWFGTGIAAFPINGTRPCDSDATAGRHPRLASVFSLIVALAGCPLWDR
jgi:hypothetical protein